MGWFSVSGRKGGHRRLRRANAIGKRALAVAAFPAVLGSLVGCQPPPKPPPPSRTPPPVVVVKEKKPCELRNFNAAAKFVVDAWAVPDARFNVGEPLRFQMRVSSPSYMNVFHVGTSCKVTRLLHNRRMVAGEIVEFPPQNIQITVKPPAGDEAFLFCCDAGRVERVGPSRRSGRRCDRKP